MGLAGRWTLGAEVSGHSEKDMCWGCLHSVTLNSMGLNKASKTASEIWAQKREEKNTLREHLIFIG